MKTFTCPSIFGSLSGANLGWAIYGYNRDPMTRLDFTDTQTAAESHFGHFRDFQQAAAAGTLPEYTFLEPAWSADGNSQHPNYDVSLGELLMRDVYYTLRNGPGWNDTLLVITYDEHGGNYDHVPPPWGATPPDSSVGEFSFDFTRFGVRIPALLISPRIAAGTVFRAKSGVIDHTSLLKTIQLRWGLKPLTARDKAAPHIGDVLTLAAPRTDASLMEQIHASKVAKLPLRNDKGTYDSHTPPDLSTTAAIGDYIQARTAAWTQHLDRLRKRHHHIAPTPTGRKKAAPKKAAPKKATAKRKQRKKKR